MVWDGDGGWGRGLFGAPKVWLSEHTNFPQKIPGSLKTGSLGKTHMQNTMLFCNRYAECAHMWEGFPGRQVSRHVCRGVGKSQPGGETGKVPRVRGVEQQGVAEVAGGAGQLAQGSLG